MTSRKSTWRKGQLQDLVFFQRGFDITQQQQRPGPYPVISSSGVTSFHDECKAQGPGVVIGRKGTLGSIHYSPTDYWPHDTTLWSKELRGNDARFVYYFLHTIDLKRFDVGNSNPTLNRNHIHDLAVLIPPVQVQERIADVLAAYDDLIANNRRRMALLEKAARLLYEEWFVCRRFPGHEHAQGSSAIPEGWNVATLGSLCPDHRDVADPTELASDTPYIGLEHMPRRSITLSHWGACDEVTSAKLRYLQGDILFGKIRPYFHKVGFALSDGVASSDAIVMRPVDAVLRSFCLLTVSSDWFVALVSKTAKEGSKMPRADWTLMQEHPIVVPPAVLLNALNEIVDPIVAQLRALALANRQLRAARDLLLPRLMSGEMLI